MSDPQVLPQAHRGLGIVRNHGVPSTDVMDVVDKRRVVLALLVEDDPDDVVLIQHALQSAQRMGQFEYRSRRVGTMAEARTALANEAFDLVLLDLTLPDMAGMDNVAAIRSAAPDAALVVLTGRDDELLARASLRTGADDYLVKGRSDDRSLERAVRYALERRGAIQDRLRDIAERDQLREQLRHAQRMEALGRLAAGVAHDFNNVLTVILGHSEMLRADIGNASDRADSVEQINLAGQRAARLTAQLLAFSRQQVASPKVFNLNDGVGDTLKMLRHLLGEHIELATELVPNLPHVRIDPGHFEQVLINLAVNARDAMQSGGLLSIRTSAVEVTEQLQKLRPYVKLGRYVVLAVNDTGCGMPEDVRIRIFEPFFTTKSLGKGTGLGLSTVYGIVKQADGYIWCTSVPGIGTRFEIYLPVCDEVEAGQPMVPSPRVEHHGGKILVVEDEKAVRAIIVRILRKAGYDVLEAENGERAIELALAHGRAIDMVLTDMVMPGRSGPQVAADIEAIVPGVRVVYMSGYTDGELTGAEKLHEQQRFLQKPFDGAELVRIVRTALGTDVSTAGS